MDDIEWGNLDGDLQDKWRDTARENLVLSGRLPLSDEAWTNDRFIFLIEDKARDMYERSLLAK